MKNLCIITLLLCFTATFAQLKPAIKMTGDPNPWGNANMRRLANWQGVDYHKVTFSGEALKGKNYYIIAKEIWLGTIKKTDTLFNSALNDYFEPVQGDTLSLTLMGGKSSDRSLKLEFYFDRFSMYSNYLATDSKEYSLRILERNSDIEPNKPFYAFAYILPYEKDGYRYYCAVESSDKDVEKWGTEFGIEHYILFEMKFF